MKGFFDKEQTKTPYKSGKGMHTCVSCGLYKYVLNPKMEPYGDFEKEIMVIGEAPGEDEDRRGRPWQGKVGRVLQRMYNHLGIDIFKDCVNLNAINCRPTDSKGNNKAPTEHQIACCRQKVLNAVKRYQPKVIILQGGIAVSSLIGYKWSRGEVGGITKWRGWTIPDREFGAWICPTFHPSFIDRQEEKNEAEVLWKKDLKAAFSKVNEPVPDFQDEEQCVEIIEDEDAKTEALKRLNDLSNYEEDPLLAFDLETTGLKPYNTDLHKIVTISFCNNFDNAIAMPMVEDPKNIRLLRELLENPKIKKTAANMVYEDNWMVTLHDIKPQPWEFDTMLATHLLDNRPGITSLKFQAYVQFGLLGYDEETSPYLKSRDSNTPNRIMELVQNKRSFQKLLIYNGIDSLVQYRLARRQMEELRI